MLIYPWRIEMLGGLKALSGHQKVLRFQTRKVASLLAYLAYYLDRSHPREELVDRFWSEMEPEAARHNFRQTLYSLRRHLEPAGIPGGSVLVADKSHVYLQPDAIATDVANFEAILRQAQDTTDPARRHALLQQAVVVYGGELLPGFYEEWILIERQRLASVFVGTLRELIPLSEQAGKEEEAISYALHALAVNTFEEDLHQDLIRLYGKVGRPREARRQYEALARMLRKEFHAEPSSISQKLIEGIDPVGGSLPVRERNVSVPVQARPTQASAPTASQAIEASATRLALPVPLTRFFGREAEIEQIHDQLCRQQTRLLTLTGPGGSGKTRLALEAARRMAATGEEAVFFVALADLSDPDFILDAIARAIGLQYASDIDLLSQLASQLGIRPALLLLDNFEHLVEGGAEIVHSLLERVPTLRCLVTSRRRLTLAGEREILVAPLPAPSNLREERSNKEQSVSLPAWNGLPGRTEEHEKNALSALLSYPSVAMFVDRAQAARPDFTVTERTLSTVATICSRLEGVPLAIELAAARMGALTASQMLEQLTDRFGLLVDRRRGVSARHRSLSAAIEWSYNRLSSEIQRFFACLSVFRGGCTVDSAKAICEEPEALEYLMQLREHSLISTLETAGEIRFRPLETLRKYGEQALKVTQRADLMERFTTYYMSFVEEAEAHQQGKEQEVWLSRLDAEIDNVRQALSWLARQNACAYLRLVGSLSFYWVIRGHFSEGRANLQEALSRSVPRDLTHLRAKALLRAGAIACHQNDYTAGRLLMEEGREIYAQLGDRDGVAESLFRLVQIASEHEDFKAAQELAEQSLALYRQGGDKRMIARALVVLGIQVRGAGDLSRAQNLFEESQALYQEMGNPRGVASTIANMANIAHRQNNLVLARALWERSIAVFRSTGDRLALAGSLGNLGAIVYQQNDYSLAYRLYAENISLSAEVHNYFHMICGLSGIVMLWRKDGFPLLAMQVRGAIEAYRERLGLPTIPENCPDYGPAPDQFSVEEHTAWTIGRLLSLSEAASFVMEHLHHQHKLDPPAASPMSD